MNTTSQVFAGVMVALSVGFTSLISSDASACHHQHDHTPVGTIETLAVFDPDKGEAPESIVIDDDDNKFVSLTLTGEIRKISANGQQSTYAKLPLGAPPGSQCGPFFNGVFGLAYDHDHNVMFANVASCDPGARGVWRLKANKAPERIVPMPMDGLPNGIVYHHGYLYVADSFAGVIWRAPASGGAAEVWASGDELLPDESNGFPGPNGLQLFEDELYVSNSSKAIVMAYPIKWNGDAGAPRLHAVDAPCDDFAFDVEGNMYCGTDPYETVLKITPDGDIDEVLDFGDGLDGPASAVFGHHGDDRTELYVINGAIPMFAGQSPRRPSLMRVKLDVPGVPR